jgi:hypothetical protein
MFKHFVGMTFRALKKNKVFSFLNIFGLAIGLACAGLIFLWVEDELSWDSSHVNKDRIYMVRVNVAQDAGTWTHSSTPGPLAPSLASMPGVAATCRVSEGETPIFRIGDRVIQASGFYAEPSLFGIFTLPFVQGNPQSAFSQLYSLVITESAAKKLFGGDRNVLGRMVRMDDKQDYKVTGVVKDMPQNSSLQFEWLAPKYDFTTQRPIGGDPIDRGGGDTGLCVWGYVWSGGSRHLLLCKRLYIVDVYAAESPGPHAAGHGTNRGGPEKGQSGLSFRILFCRRSVQQYVPQRNADL